ncbi:MAG: TetR/AcrR family transcriptional regulator, partial [Microcoleus sp. T3-bin5]|nr:TetR/AcrR family transcriptional regulator [Microcoleus sp. T3-bin5]
KVEKLMDYLSQNEDYILKSLLMIFDFCQQKTRQQINNNQTLQQSGKRYEEAVNCYLGISDPAIAKFIICYVDGLLVRRFYQGERISIAEQLIVLKEMLLAYLEKN